MAAFYEHLTVTFYEHLTVAFCEHQTVAFTNILVVAFFTKIKWSPLRTLNGRFYEHLKVVF